MSHIITKEDVEGLKKTRPNNAMLTQHLKDQLANGFSIFYGESDYPGLVVEERPDGKRFLLKQDKETGWKKVIIKELPPKVLPEGVATT